MDSADRGTLLKCIRFAPDDYEVIEEFLDPRKLSSFVPGSVIADSSLLSIISGDTGPWDCEKYPFFRKNEYWLFVSRESLKRGRQLVPQRRLGSKTNPLGTWKGQTSYPIRKGNAVVGYKQKLVLLTSENLNTGWQQIEYRRSFKDFEEIVVSHLVFDEGKCDVRNDAFEDQLEAEILGENVDRPVPSPETAAAGNNVSEALVENSRLVFPRSVVAGEDMNRDINLGAGPVSPSVAVAAGNNFPEHLFENNQEQHSLVFPRAAAAAENLNLGDGLEYLNDDGLWDDEGWNIDLDELLGELPVPPPEAAAADNNFPEPLTENREEQHCVVVAGEDLNRDINLGDGPVPPSVVVTAGNNFPEPLVENTQVQHDLVPQAVLNCENLNLGDGLEYLDGLWDDEDCNDLDELLAELPEEAVAADNNFSDSLVENRQEQHRL